MIKTNQTDYTEDLAIMKMIWEEKLTKQNMEFYKNNCITGAWHSIQ